MAKGDDHSWMTPKHWPFWLTIRADSSSDPQVVDGENHFHLCVAWNVVYICGRNVDRALASAEGGRSYGMVDWVDCNYEVAATRKIAVACGQRPAVERDVEVRI